MEEHEIPHAKWENRYYRNTRNVARLQGKKKAALKDVVEGKIDLIIKH